MYLSRRVTAVAVGVSMVAAVTPVWPWAALALGVAVLVSLAALDVSRAPRPDSMRPARSGPDVLRVGVPAEMELTLHNPIRRPLRVAIRDASPPSIGRSPLRHELTMPPEAWVSLRATLAPSRRGLARLGPITIRAAGPLGLAGRQRAIRLADTIKVYPALPARAEVRSRLDRARALGVGERSSAVRGGGTEFDSLREYHLDDEFRRINWLATARRTKPMTNMYREERNQQVLLLLDAGRTMAGTVANASRFEHALDAAFAVAELAGRAGDHVGMVAFAEGVLAMVSPRGGPSQPRRILDSLFALQPQLRATDYVGAFSAVLSRYRRRSLLMVLTELTSDAVAEPLYAALPVLLRRHLVVVGSVRDPELESLGSSRPADSARAYAKAAAAGALLERDRVAARLRRMGVPVDDRPPGRLAGAMADRYLRIKALGRL
jgi:uncharacterized protein (DUF58 family)